MTKTVERQHPLLLASIALSLALLSAVFVVGVGNAGWWFAGTLITVVLLGFLIRRYQTEDGVTRSLTSPLQNLHRSVCLTILLLDLCCVVALAWLVLHRQPLPGADLSQAALVTVLFSLATIGLVLYFLRLSLLSFPILVLGTTFMYTASPLILFQSEGGEAFRYWRFIDIEHVLLGMPVVMLAFAAFLGGALASNLSRPQPTVIVRNTWLHSAHNESLRQVGLILYALSMLVVVWMSLRGSGLQLAFEGGYRSYAGARESGELPLLLISAFRLLGWVVLILAGTSQTRRRYQQTWLLSIPALILMLLSGDRTVPLALILLLGSSGYLLGLAVDWKRTLVVIALVALLVPTVVNLRQTPIREWSLELFTQAVLNQVEGSRQYEYSPLAAPLIAMGTNYQTLMGTLMLVPKQEPYRYGADYARAAAMILPFTASIYPYLGIRIDVGKPSEWVKNALDPDGEAGTGYLQMAEAYLQFGVWGVIVLYVLLGWFLPRLWWHSQEHPDDGHKLAVYLILMMGVVTWVRNDSIGVVRGLAWGWLIVYGGPLLLDKLRGVAGPPSQLARWRR